MRIQVGRAVVPIPNIGEQSLYGINSGTTVLYYSDEPGVSAQTGMPLDPGNAVQSWPARKAMYIMAPSGIGSFSYENNGSQISIGATTATIDGPVTLAGPVSLAPGQQINAEIVNQLQAQIVGAVQANITNASLPVTGAVNATVINQLQSSIVGTVQTAITNASLPVTGTVSANVVNALQATILNKLSATIDGAVDSTIKNTAAAPVIASMPGGVVINSGSVNAAVSGSVSITGTPNVAIASGTVNIGTAPALTIASGQVNAAVSGAVSITGTPNVAIASGTVNIGTAPALTIASGQVNAAVSGAVSITGTPSVAIASGTVNANISGGTVNIASGSVNVGSVGTITNTVTTKSITNLTALSTTTATAIGGTAVTVYDSNTLGTDITSFEALILQFGGVAMSGVDTSRQYEVAILQYSASGMLVKEERPGFFGSGLLRYNTALVGKRLVIQVRNVLPGVTGTTNLVGMAVELTASHVEHYYYQFPGTSGQYFNASDVGSVSRTLSKAAVYRVSASASGSVGQLWFLETVAGLATCNATSGPTDTSVVIALQSQFGGAVQVYGLPTLSNTVRNQQFQFNFPEVPVNVRCVSPSTQENGLSITWA